MKTKHMTKLFAGFSVALAVQTAFAGNITDINVSTLPDNQKIIKIRFDKDVTTPHGFVTSTPARIALDFANTNIRLPQPVLEYADPLLNQITAAQNNDRARVVLGLNKISQYNTEIRGNEVWVFVNESTDQTNAAVANERAATPSTARAAQTIKPFQQPISISAKAHAILALLNCPPQVSAGSRTLNSSATAWL